jgi:uncharacterized OB-fold protein
MLEEVSSVQKPVPVPDADSRDFWSACAEHRLLIQECGVCGHLQFYPRMVCTACGSRQVGWKEAGGDASVYSYSVVRRAPSEAFAKDVPYVLALVELDEGVRMMTNVVGCDPSQVTIGMRVRVLFEDLVPGISLPKFAPLPS